MTFDEILAALKTPDETPNAALAAAVPHADALAPAVFERANKLLEDMYLLPDQNALLFHGLHVLAAARHPRVLDCTLALVDAPQDQLDRLFSHHASISLARLLLSVWDRPPEDLFGLIENGDAEEEGKWALFNVLGRLAFDGRIPREQVAGFLARLESDSVFEDNDMAWWGWESAVTRLGLAELEPALRRVWTKSINAHQREQDRTESLEELHYAARNPDDPAEFEVEELRTIDDPVEAVAWVEKRAEILERLRGDAEPDDDPARAVRLTEGEQDWLAGLLVSRQVPETTMPFEMLDGFLTAVVIGPDMVLPSEYMPLIWGGEDEAPVWASMEQAQYAIDLLMKHWNAIAARRNADAPHAPFIVPINDEHRGKEWAVGFLMGVSQRSSTWATLFQDEAAAPVVMSIVALCSPDAEAFEEEITPELRAEFLAQLPYTLQAIARYWSDHEAPSTPPRRQPIRTNKIGRNEPCPCGSGKKYKKCCGGPNAPTVH